MNLDWRYKRQECFDITKRKLNSFDFDGKPRLVYDNVNLSIFLGDYCNAGCEFCVARLRYVNDGSEYLKPKIEDTDEYLKRVDYLLKITSHLNPSVSLTGGEPTHYEERLVPIIKLLNKHNIRKRTITTNGTGLFFLYDGKPILQHLMENGFEHLNISKAHYDDQRNNELMKYTKVAFDNNFLFEVQKYLAGRIPRVRLSCVLLNEGIGTVSEMKKYMEVALKHKVDNVVFRELMRYNMDTINKHSPIFHFCEKNRVNLVDVWEQLDNDPDFSFLNQVLGYYYYVEVYNYKGVAMVSESANLKQIYIEKENVIKKTGIPVVYEMVIHPNGSLNGSWREWEDILIEP